MSELSDRIAELMPRLRELQRMQKRLGALAQQCETIITAGGPDSDWEDRYVAEGIIELEQQGRRR